MIPSGLMERMRRMQTDMERGFNEFFRGESSGAEGMSLAPVDMYESENEIIAKFDIPGVEKNDIDVQVCNDVLEVKAEKTSEMEEKKEGSLISERAFKGYYRKVSLPAYAKSEGIKAEYKDGTLTVTIPKDVDKVRSSKVEVE